MNKKGEISIFLIIWISVHALLLSSMVASKHKLEEDIIKKYNSEHTNNVEVVTNVGESE